MRTWRTIGAAALALTLAIGFWPSSVEATDPEYEYAILSGIQYGQLGDVTLTAGWYPLPYAEDLTGPCLPRRPRTVVRHDLLVLALERCALPSITLSYGAPSTTGSVTDDGDYAFLSDPDDLTTAVTTYEGLRTGLRDGATIGLVLHQNAGAGASQADFYNLVEANDVVEWREANDCWVRYQVTAIEDDPPGDPPRKLFKVRAYSYAYTGCTSGTLRTTGARTVTWTPTTIKTGRITTPFYHGPFVVAPSSWTGDLPEIEQVTPSAITWPPDPLPSADLGSGWTGGVSARGADYGHALHVFYRHISGGWIEGWIQRLAVWPRAAGRYTNTPRVTVNTADIIVEWFALDGRPAGVTSNHEDEPLKDASVYVYDADTGVLYMLYSNFTPPANDPAVVIELARQLLSDAQ